MRTNLLPLILFLVHGITLSAFGQVSSPAPAKSQKAAGLPSPVEAKKELEAIYAEWVQLAMEGRTEELSRRFRDPEFVAFKSDGTAYSPEEQSAISSSKKPNSSRRYLSIEVKPDKVWVHPDGRIFEYGTNTSVTQNGEEPSKASTVRYLAIWHRQPDGSLKYRTDIALDKN